jgi:hypothetical protein
MGFPQTITDPKFLRILDEAENEWRRQHGVRDDDVTIQPSRVQPATDEELARLGRLSVYWARPENAIRLKVPLPSDDTPTDEDEPLDDDLRMVSEE